MGTIIIYKSRTGYTKKYADWIAEELGFQSYDYKSAMSLDLSQFDTIIFGGSLHASGILGLKNIKKKLDFSKTKKLLVFAVGATPPVAGLEKMLTEKNVGEEERSMVKIFFMRGGFNYDRLNPIDKMLMSMMKRGIMKKKEGERTADEKGMLAAFDYPLDFTNRKNILPIINYYRRDDQVG
ncbi:flavodoxin domain-containing protein [Petrocella sp. FN5]|uniref:flavodoxin domain-containing protein n=1 Tax=Petrocella sp. FN5 TaxID=3032002 RepID=UPI0023DA1710|nr:flavodoxin domain-containing protein [Petrocella sp. FN5]MDF1617173.1 flavodoxin domain-containing protein [Petrocella sp. FN5]